MSEMTKIPDYHKIYEHIYENPGIPLHEIARNTGLSKRTVSQYLKEMYDTSVLKGPLIFLKPAQNYTLYAAFLDFAHPVTTYQRLKEVLFVIHSSLSSGGWNLLLICKKMMNFSVEQGFNRCIYQGAKSVTYLSKVTSLEWDQSMKRMYSAISPPKEKSTLYEDVPSILWNLHEWTLYHQFRLNTRVHAVPVLNTCNIPVNQYQKWMSALPQFARVQPAFYPYGLDNYFVLDFLFQSCYHTQLVHILGMLPSTIVFFSAGQYLLARISLLTKNQETDLFSFVLELEDNNYFTKRYQTMVISTSGPGD